MTTTTCHQCQGRGVLPSWAFNGFHDLKCDVCAGTGSLPDLPSRDTRPAPPPTVEETLADVRKACEHACEAFVALSTRLAALQLIVAEDRRNAEREREAREALERRVLALEAEAAE